MDPTVPAGAARLLDFARQTEVGTEEPRGYDVIYGFNQDKLAKPVTQMSVDEVLAQQSSWSSRFGSSAAGAYQFMRATLGDLKRELNLRGGQIMDANLQDRLAYHLLKRRGYEQFIAGSIDRTEFGKRLAQEWASFPVLAAVRGAHQQLARGQSYYAGDRLNKALVSPERFEAVIDEALALARAPVAAPVPLPRPEPEPIYPPIGHNGGPPLEPVHPRNPKPSPVEQSAKAVGAGKWAAIAGALWTAVVSVDVLPPAFTTPEFVAAVTAMITAVAGAVGSYRAPKNAEPS
ncbi:hypothetical protein [Aliihoeflea sp. 40Bstr573]|uniref:hypothetical protein n=1 Tax=Aliihoeflea sp. 40Bstr573 TaxID=2696467 RepID=UPI0020947435|nr:hypothetical protein [Aliihoeflea sp. 40Bstr573]MCO6386341.1 hypothetical protein [Aliihoeflea sp. 40Bstr573]